MIRLRAEMRVPGRAWLEFEAHSEAGTEVSLRQTAYCAPRGVFGLLYWYALYPILAVVFGRLIAALARKAEAMVTAGERKQEPASHSVYSASTVGWDHVAASSTGAKRFGDSPPCPSHSRYEIAHQSEPEHCVADPPQLPSQWRLPFPLRREGNEPIRRAPTGLRHAIGFHREREEHQRCTHCGQNQAQRRCIHVHGLGHPLQGESLVV